MKKKRKRYKWDAFICHVSEDKNDFVIPLAEELQKFGVRLWLDKFTLKVGDSLRQKIDEGLSQSRYGIVILSPSFFDKNWPQAELDGLFAREMEGEKVLLPVWHRITKEEVHKKAPTLALKQAALSTEGIVAVTQRLVEVIRPKALKLDQSQTDARRANIRLLDQLKQTGTNPTIDYRVIAGQGSTPPSFDLESLDKLGNKDVVASFFRSGMRIDLVPKVLSDYLKSPLNITIGFRDAGVEKFKKMMETGIVQSFTAGEFGDVQMDVALFPSFKGPATTQTLVVKPSPGENIPVRVTFGSGSESIIYELMQYRTERSGTLEAAAIIRGKDTPFVINLLVKRSPTLDLAMTIEPHLKGRSIRVVQKYVEMKRALWKSGVVSIFNLETSSSLISGRITIPAPSESDIWFGRLVEDVASIANFFSIDIKSLDDITEADIELLILLKWMIEKKSYGTGARFTSVMTKTTENADLLNTLNSGISIALTREGPLMFLGITIEDYTLAFSLENVQIKDFDLARERYDRARIGENIELTFETAGTILVKLWDTAGHRPLEKPNLPRRNN